MPVFARSIEESANDEAIPVVIKAMLYTTEASRPWRDRLRIQRKASIWGRRGFYNGDVSHHRVHKVTQGKT